jgi:hypothetical protein
MSTYADKATELVLGDRNASYGPPAEDYAKTAAMWSGLLNGILTRPITPKEAVLMMVALKLSREMHRHKPDNLIDAHGYLLCAEWIATGKKPAPKEHETNAALEDVCCGAKMQCARCGKNLPCLCDRADADE